jgi:hypothetical protein
MLGGFTRSLFALVHFTLHTGAGVDSVVYMPIIGKSPGGKVVLDRLVVNTLSGRVDALEALCGLHSSVSKHAGWSDQDARGAKLLREKEKQGKLSIRLANLEAAV